MRRNVRTRLARGARLLGFDRNPLRRLTDRIEAVIRLATLVLLLAAVPLATLAAGREADDLALRQAHAQRAADHKVTATLLQQAPSAAVPDPYTSVQMTRVPARWQPPGQPARTGQILAPVGARAGSTVTVWVDASGAVTNPPPDHRTIVGDVCVAALVTCLVTSMLVLGASTLARRALDRRRLNAWDAEWRVTGPRWSGHRS